MCSVAVVSPSGNESAAAAARSEPATVYNSADISGNATQNQPPLAVPPDQVPSASSDIQDQLQRTLNKDPDLKDAQVTTRVDENTIVLKGTAQDETQHQRILQLAQTYAGKRKIVDNLVVKQKS